MVPEFTVPTWFSSLKVPLEEAQKVMNLSHFEFFFEVFSKQTEFKLLV